MLEIGFAFCGHLQEYRGDSSIGCTRSQAAATLDPAADVSDHILIHAGHNSAG
ncbi:hypothetical protein ACUXST_002294 [Sphingomonas sp. F9_3S_D5_B_2]